MSETKINRRAFAKAVAVGTTAAVPILVPGHVVPAQEEPAPSQAELLLEVIKQRYPAEFTEDELAEVRRDVEGHVGRSKTLSDFPLANADEPGFVFAAYRGEGTIDD
jgi:hypothetical protein